VGGGTSAAPVHVARAASAIDQSVVHYVDSKMGQVKAEIGLELAKLEASLVKAEAQRSVDFQQLSTNIQGVQSTLPTKDTIRNYFWGGAGLVVAAMALIWGAFGTGAGLTGSFADKIVETKEAAHSAKEQNEAILKRLDALTSRQENAGANPQTGTRAGPNAGVPSAAGNSTAGE
jgi:hypothetical protein